MPLGLHTAELNFETIKEIGQEGRNSQVFLAHDKQLDAEIVVKKIYKDSIQNASDYFNEAKKLYQSSHTNVVKVSYGCSDDNYIYIAMPYYKNGSLKSLIEKRNLTIREIIRYSIQFLQGLHHIHSKGLIHFDIKPDNIMISDNNEALLSDFGLAKAMNEFGLANPDRLYIKQVPPEMFQSTDTTFLFDIYQVGVTLYRLLNGENHFEKQLCSFTNNEDFNKSIMEGNFPDRDNYLPHIPPSLKKIVNKAISVKLEDRHQSVLELINELGDIEENLDWSFSETEQKKYWEKSNDNYTYKIEVDYTNPKSISMTTTKANKITNKSQRQTKYCHTGLTNSNILSKIKSALKL